MSEFAHEDKFNKAKSTFNIDNIVKLADKILLSPLLSAAVVAWSYKNGDLYENLPRFAGLAGAGILVSILYFFRVVSRRYLKIKGWKLTSRDVAVITGGSNGLGHYIAYELSKRGVRVAILDREKPARTLPGSTYYFCDLTDKTVIDKAFAEVQRDMGPISILVNNAGMMCEQRVQDLGEKLIRNLFEVNIVSHFWTLQAVIPDFLKYKRGWVVSIASTVGLIGPGHMSAYTASKHAVVGLHDSITHEKGLAGVVGTTLVCPGQMNTRLFADLSTPTKFFAPVVESQNLAKIIVDNIANGQRGEVIEPLYARLTPLARVTPHWVGDFARWATNLDGCMEEVEHKKVGRGEL